MALKRILHVDDDEDIRTIVQLALEVVGEFEILQFGNGPGAVAGAVDFRPDLLLLDVMMPGMSGPEVWRALTALPQLADIPAIFVTAKAEDEFSRDLTRQGAMAVIVKPFDPMTLASQIQEIWDRNH